MKIRNDIADRKRSGGCLAWLVGLLLLGALPGCENATKDNPSLPLGTKIILNDGREAWITSKRFYSGAGGCYDVRYAVGNGYKTITAWEYEFHVSESNAEVRHGAKNADLD